MDLVMSTKLIGLVFSFLCFGLPAFAQNPSDQSRIVYPTEEQIAKYKRLSELLRHPTFVILRLVSARRSSPAEEPSVTPSPYTVDQWINFELFITQNSSENIVVWSSAWPYYQYRPELTRDGDSLSYSKVAQQNVETADSQPPSGSGGVITLVPGQEYSSTYVRLEDWYETPLRPGHYQLIVRKRLRQDGDWVESNPLTFDVIPRKAAAPIPEGLSLRLIPDLLKPSPQPQRQRF